MLVAAAGGVWLWTSGGGGGSAGPDTPAGKDYEAGVQELGAAEVVWQVEQGVASGATGADDYWSTGEHLVRRLPGRVVAYELKTGKEAWELPVGKCPSSVEHSNLRVALLVATGEGTDGACENLVVVSEKVALVGDVLLAQAKCSNKAETSIRLLNTHIRSSSFRGDNQLAFWRDGLLVIFKAVHRDSTIGEADTVAFALTK